MRRSLLPILFFWIVFAGAMVIMLVLDRGSGGIRQAPDPAYFFTMTRGRSLERAKSYRRAIEQYQLALRQVERVDPELVRGGKMAAHNRMAACYRALGDAPRAIEEFKISLKLGDKKYAQKAIDKLQRQQ